MVEASDPENNTLTYNIISNDNNLFKIDSRNGILSLVSNQSLDYSNLAQHTIIVQVSNLSLTKDVSITIDVLTVPTLAGAFTFTYNQIVNSLAMNNGGSVESFSLISNNLPAGLKLTNKNRQLVIEGTPTKVTLDGTVISAVSLVIEASNKCGLNRSSVDVTVNPKFVSGDQSLGIVHAVSNATVDHTHGILSENVTHKHAGSAANSPLIHVANNISFASGGTGSVADPVLIGVKSDATNLSFVVDFNNVMIPNFDATSNNAFLIQLVGIPVGATISSFAFEYMEALDTNNEIDFSFPPHISINLPFTVVLSDDPVGVILSTDNLMSVVTVAPQIIRMIQRRTSAITGTLDGRIRITIKIAPPSL